MSAEVTKPDFSYQWASGGAIVTPSNVKIQTGWTAEVPPFQWENYLQNRQDNAILHLFQKGISEWDAVSNYYFTASGTRSYVQGSDGLIYVAVQDSVGQNPTTDVSDTYWKIAFADNGTALTTTTGDARYVQRSNNLSDLANVATARTNLGVADAVVAGTFGYSDLKVTTTGLSALVTITAKSLCLKNSSNVQKVVNSVNITTLSIATSGVNGLDTGTSTASTWYYLWVISDGTTTAGLISLSDTSPTMPGAYTYKMFVGAIFTDATGNKFPFPILQRGADAQFLPAAGTNLTLLPVIGAGIQGTVGTTGVAVSGVNLRVPPNVSKLKFIISSLSINGTVQLSPVPIMTITQGGPAATLGNSGAGFSLSLIQDMLLATNTVYYAGNSAGCSAACYGWTNPL